MTSEAFAETLDEPHKSNFLASLAKVRAEKAQRAQQPARSPRGTDKVDAALASGVYGEEGT